MIQEAFAYVEQTPDLETKLKLIDTLRTVTAGKVKLALIFDYAASSICLKVDELFVRLVKHQHNDCASFQFKIID